MKEKVLKLLKQYEGYTDRSMTDTAIGSDNFEELAEEIAKLFAKPDDSNRREQLIAFADWYKTTDFNCEGCCGTDCVDEYLKSN